MTITAGPTTWATPHISVTITPFTDDQAAGVHRDATDLAVNLLMAALCPPTANVEDSRLVHGMITRYIRELTHDVDYQLAREDHP